MYLLTKFGTNSLKIVMKISIILATTDRKGYENERIFGNLKLYFFTNCVVSKGVAKY